MPNPDIIDYIARLSTKILLEIFPEVTDDPLHYAISMSAAYGKIAEKLGANSYASAESVSACGALGADVGFDAAMSSIEAESVDVSATALTPTPESETTMWSKSRPWARRRAMELTRDAVLQTAALATMSNDADLLWDCRRYADACHTLYRAYHQLAGNSPTPEFQAWHEDVDAALRRAEKAADLPVGFYH